MSPDLLLQDLFYLRYVDEFYDKLTNKYKVYFSIQGEVEERYQNSKRKLLDYLRQNQESEPAKEIINQITRILDAKNEINDQIKVVLMWHRFSRFDLFQGLEFTGWELNVVSQNFFNHLRTKYNKDGKFDLLSRAWEAMMNLSLKPSILLRPLEEQLEASEDMLQPETTPMKKEPSSMQAIGSSNLSDSTYVSHITTNPDSNASTTNIKQTTKSAQAYINSHNRRNRLIEYLGLFIPEISPLKQPKTPFFLNAERYESLRSNGTYEELSVKLANKLEKCNVNVFQTNVIKRIENLLSVRFKFKFLNEEPTVLGINESKFSIKLDIVIEIGENRIIPIEIKSNLREVYINFINSSNSNFSDLGKEKIPFCMIYSQVFRECISCNSLAAFVSDGSFTLFIKIVPPTNFSDNWTFYRSNTYKFLPCHIFVVETNKQFINCALDAARDTGTEATKNELEKLVAKFYNEKPPIEIICENFYQRFHLLLAELEYFLSKRRAQEDNDGIVGKGEVGTELMIDGEDEADETTISAATQETGTTIRTLNGASTISHKSEPDDRGITVDEVFSKAYIEILKNIKHSYNSSFEIKHLDEILKEYQILDVLGGKTRFGNNAVVLEIQSRRTNEQLILKVYDPLYSTALIRKKYQLNSAIRDVTRSFIRECCSYYLLKKNNFQNIPKVYTVGILKSDANIMMKSLDAESKQVNLKGYFIIMEKLTLSKSLTEMGKLKREPYKNEIYRLSDLMHSYNISHGDIFSGNILVQESGAAPRIVFIDFGSSKVSRDRKDSPFLKTATGKNRFELSVARDNYKLKHLFSNSEPEEAKQEAELGRKRLLLTTGGEVPKSKKRRR